MLIYASPLFAQAEEECKSYVLPNVKLYERTAARERYEPGYETMREVVRKRLATLEPTPLTPDDLFEPGVLDKLILKSGGVMRTLIGLVHDACTEAELRDLDTVNAESAQEAVNTRAAQLSYRLDTKRLKELQHVYENHRMSGEAVSDELLHGLLIAAYRNGTAWFDVHPLLWDELPGRNKEPGS